MLSREAVLRERLPLCERQPGTQFVEMAQCRSAFARKKAKAGCLKRRKHSRPGQHADTQSDRRGQLTHAFGQQAVFLVVDWDHDEARTFCLE
jgi:hypothetical protein